MKRKVLLTMVLASIFMVGCRKEGCTDQAASNYDSNAKNDNGSCIYGNDPNNPGGGGTGPGGETLPIRLTSENVDKTIIDQSTNPNVADYYIDGNWSISADVVIQPGVRILMKAGAQIGVESNGSISAVGMASNKIEIFGEQDVKGYWRYIFIESNNPNNKLIYCTISNGSSGTWGDGMVTLDDNSQLTMQHTSLLKGSLNGLEVQGGAQLPSFQSNYIDNFTQFPMNLKDFGMTRFLDNSTQIGGNNGEQVIHIYGSSHSVAVTIPNLGIPYYVKNFYEITDKATQVEAGTVIVFGPGSGIEVESSASLFLDGNATNHIKIKGDQPAKGWWDYIYINSNNPNNIFSYTDFSDGGKGTWEDAMIGVDGGQLNMNNCSITNGKYKAIDGGGTFNDNGGNSWLNCDGGGGLLP